jgi:hypothetical protein
MEEALGYFYEALAILEDLPDSEDNRRRRGATVRCEALDLGARATGRAAEDLEVDGLGLRRRVGAELVGEEAPAALVQAECLGRVAGRDVRLHQRAVARLAEGLEGGDLGRMPDCVPELPLGERRIAQAFERTHEQVTEVASLILDPSSVLAGQKHPPSELGRRRGLRPSLVEVLRCECRLPSSTAVAAASTSIQASAGSVSW